MMDTRQIISLIIGMAITVILWFLMWRIIIRLWKRYGERVPEFGYCTKCGGVITRSVCVVAYDRDTGDPKEYMHQITCKRCEWDGPYSSEGIRFRTAIVYKPTLEDFDKFGTWGNTDYQGNLISIKDLGE